jgi:lycopene beta-cyclase
VNDYSFYNFTIVGAGASGLWLAHALLENGLLENNSICIVESDQAKENDRTWCYWASQAIAPQSMVSKEWELIRQPQAKQEIETLNPYRYFHVRSADFYAQMKATLKICKSIDWKFEKVVDVNESSQHVAIKTTKEQWLSERVFLSTWLTPPKQHKLFLWQSFVGWRVKTTEAAFDDSSMSMMDFNVAQSTATQFMYELPYSKHEALVEMTRFGADKLSTEEAEDSLKDYMTKKGCLYEIMEIETGAIPMTPQFDVAEKSKPATERIIFIGTPGGAIKPTTGFGFKRMQAHANALAQALKHKTALPTLHRNFRFRLYDILLLQILKRHPHRGKEIFERLFGTQPIQRILKFLDEETKLTEEIAIFARLPIGLFLRSLFVYVFKS